LAIASCSFSSCLQADAKATRQELQASDYQIISGNSLYRLEVNVKEQLKSGYKPVGGISITSIEKETTYLQAMYK